MKKLTALFSALALLLFLCACSNEAGGTASEDATQQPTASQAVSAPPIQDTDPVNTPVDEQPSETPTSAVSETDVPTSDVPESSAPTTPDPTQEPTAEPTAEPSAPADLKAIAISLIDHPVSELIDAIGEPISSDYAPGCLEPDSEDGELIYDGFVVYTVRTATREYVYDVL